MTAEAASAKAAELGDLLKLAGNPAWRTVVEPFIQKARDAHLAAATARNATPAQRAEHIEACHFAGDLLALVPGRIAKLREQLAAHQARGGEETLRMGDLPR